MISYKDATDPVMGQFQQWRREHAQDPTQFFANERPQEWMLHRPACSHFESAEVDPNWNMTKSEKICGTLKEIEQEVRKREVGKRHLVNCSHCIR